MPLPKDKKALEEYKKKMSRIMKGKTPWNKGKSSWNKGKPWSKEMREKLSKAHKGKKLSKETREKMSKSRKGNKYSLGFKHTLEMRLAKSKRQKGSKCHLWKGGITPKNHRIRYSFEMKLWRESVFIRDNWTCQKCNKRGVELNAHHIHNFADYPELRTAIDNGIALCKKCHKEFHKQFGVEKNNQEQLNLFLTIKL